MALALLRLQACLAAQACDATETAAHVTRIDPRNGIADWARLRAAMRNDNAVEIDAALATLADSHAFNLYVSSYVVAAVDALTGTRLAAETRSRRNGTACRSHENIALHDWRCPRPHHLRFQRPTIADEAQHPTADAAEPVAATAPCAATRIRFVVVGGLAMLLQGVDRLTADADLVVDLAAEELADAIRALTASGYRPLAPVDPLALADAAARADWQRSKGMTVFSFWDSTR